MYFFTLSFSQNMPYFNKSAAHLRKLLENQAKCAIMYKL